MKKFTALLMSVALLLTTISVSVFNIHTTVHADESSWPQQPDIIGTSACLIEASTGTILYEKKPHKKMYPASITKILSALVTLENAELDEEVTFSEEAVYSVQLGDAHMEMQVGEVMSVQDCLYGLMLKSANEVAVALAEHVGGSVEDFAKMMNDRAVQAGAKASNFVNPNGLHDDNHYVTAYDMAMITRDAIQNPVFLSITGSTAYTVNSNKKKDFTVYQRHQMVRPTNAFYYEGILGGKTGFTDQSGTTLVSYAKRNGMTLICVVLRSNSTNVYRDTTELFDYGFENFTLVKPADNDNRFKNDSDSYTDRLTPVFGNNDNATLSISTDDNIVLPKKAAFSDLTSIVSFDVSTDSGEGNSADGVEVANISYNYDGRDVGTASVIYTSDNQSDSAVSANVHTSDKEDSSTQKADKDKQKKKSSKSIDRSTITKVIKAIVFIAIIIIIITLIRKKQKRLNEIRARKRRRSRTY